MIKKLKQYLFIFCCFLIVSDVAWAESQSLGTAIGHVLGPLGILGELVHIVCIIAGIGFIVGAFVRFRRHRQNPVEAPLSSGVMLLLTGLALLALSLIPMPM